MKPKHLIFSLLAMFASFSAKAADGDTFTAPIGDENSRMTLKVLSEANRTVEVSSVSDNDVTAVTIASTYTNGETEYTVVSIGNFAFKDKDNLIELNLPNTITSIGLRAFMGCTALGSPDHTFTIPSNVTTIESEAFSGCGFFAGPIPTSVTSIGSGAFTSTGWLQNQPDGIVYINNMVYTYKGTMPASSSLTVAEGTTRIINDAFKNQENLEAITLPSTLTAVESYAFSGCSNLTSVTVDATTPPTCPADAFSNAANATLYVPYGLVETYQAATGWKNFSEIQANMDAPIVFEDAWVKRICVNKWDRNQDGELSYAEAASVKDIIKSTFSGQKTITSFNEFQYFTGLEEIKDQTFSYCSSLTSIVIPNGVTSIGSNAFDGCPYLCSVTIPSSVRSIGEYAFAKVYDSSIPPVPIKFEYQSIEAMCNITFANDFLNFQQYGFTQQIYINGEHITELTIPNGVTTIPSFVFIGCKDLVSVNIPNSVTSIGSDAFTGCTSLTKAEFESIESFCNINFNGINSNPMTYAGHLYINGQEVTDVVIPNNVTSIGNYAFTGCSSLTSITIPNNVTSIGNYAFTGCSSLTSITIPNDVTSIGGSAFRGCSSLTSITIPEGVTSIGAYTFMDCSGLTSITIPNGVTSIGTYAFANCI